MVMSKDGIILPVFLLPEIVLFPGMNLPLLIFEEKYKKMISDCLKKDKKFGVVLAKDDLCAEVGTIAEIVEVEELENGKMNITAEGKNRFRIIELIREEPYCEATVEFYEDIKMEIDNKLKKSIDQIRELSLKALSMFDQISEQPLFESLKLPSDPSELMFLVASNLTCTYQVKQTILELRSIKDRSKKVLSLLKGEIKKLNVMIENKKTKKYVVKNGKLDI